MGGSHAQRQVLLLTAQEAARRSGDRALADALAAEQAVHRTAAQAPRRSVIHGKVQADAVACRGDCLSQAWACAST